MPVALAPSAVFPISEPEPMVTETQASFSGSEAAPLASPMPYRGPNIPVALDQVITQAPSVVAQLKSLSARLEALSGPAGLAAADPPAPEPRPAQLEGSRGAPAPWEGHHYDTFANFAGEASRVRNTGRLPFGSDSKKMVV